VLPYFVVTEEEEGPLVLRLNASCVRDDEDVKVNQVQ
jgi:hypothetical protein